MGWSDGSVTQWKSLLGSSPTKLVMIVRSGLSPAFAAAIVPTVLPFRSASPRISSFPKISKHPRCNPVKIVIGAPAFIPRTRDGAKSLTKSTSRVRLFQYRLEHRREIARRGIDDLQYLGGCGLLLQCFARLGDQPRVLHRDDRLRREVLQQRDLLIGKRPHLLPIRANSPEQFTFQAQGHAEIAMGASRLN